MKIKELLPLKVYPFTLNFKQIVEFANSVYSIAESTPLSYL